MQISLNESEYCKLNIHCELDNEVISSKKDEVVKKFREKPIQGFRQGKAPDDVIKLKFAKEIHEELKRSLAVNAFESTILEKDLKPFGTPQFSSVNLERDKFSCDFTLFVKPTFELKEYKNFEIPSPPSSINVDDLSQKMLQELRVKLGSASPYEENDFVQEGDSITIDYKGYLNDQEIDGLEAKGEVLTIGQTTLEGFDNAILGMKLDEERSFEINIPESSPNKELAGKQVKFLAKVLMGSKVVPASLDDDFAKRLGIDNFSDLMGQVRGAATARVEELKKQAIQDQINRRLVSIHDFKVPEWISLAEAQVNAQNLKLNWNSLQESYKEQLISNASDSIKLSLVLEKVRENEPEAQLTDEEVFNIAKENISKVSQNPQEVFENLYKNGHLPILFNRIRDENTIEFIQKTCKIVE